MKVTCLNELKTANQELNLECKRLKEKLSIEKSVFEKMNLENQHYFT